MDLKVQKQQSSMVEIEMNQETIKVILFNYDLFKKISQFLSLHDVLTLSQTCRILNEFVEKYQQFYGEIYYQQFLNNQLEMTLEISYPDVQKRNQIRKNNLENCYNDWKHQLKTMIQIKNTLRIPFLFNESIFPKPILKRETIGQYCETEYQIMLAQRIELEQKGFERLFEYQFISDELMNNLKQNKQIILSEMFDKLQNNFILKEEFLKARWTLENESQIFGQLSLNQFKSQQIDNDYKIEQIEQIDNESICIVKLLNQIYQSTQCYLEGLEQYFNIFTNQNFINAIDLLNEYVMYWQAYSNTIQELCTIYYPLENIVNELHQQLYPNYPQYPKFSIWRLMVKLWIKYIIRQNEMQTILTESFSKLIYSERQKNFKKEFDQGVNYDLDYIPSFQITYEIYDNYILKQRNSFKEQYQIETNHICFNEIIELLRSFQRSIQDISISEVSVHWIGHKDCIYEDFYDQLSLKIQHDTSKFYDETRGVFGSNIESFIEFIKFDKDFLQQILPEPLMFKLESLQKEHIFTSLFYHLEHQYLGNFVKTNTEQIIQALKINKQKSPKQERTSITSSQNNEHLDTQGDVNLNDPQRFFLFSLENSNLDLEELLLKEKNKNQHEPLIEILRVALSRNLDQQNLFDLDDINQFNQENLFEFHQPPHKIHRTFSHTKLNCEHTEIPDEIIKSLKQYLFNSSEFVSLYNVFNEYINYYDKNLIQIINKDKDIEIINNDRELPRILPEYLQDFYYLSKSISKTILEDNMIQDELEDELDLPPPDLSKNSSKLQKNSVQMEVYYSEEEEIDENQNCNDMEG